MVYFVLSYPDVFQLYKAAFDSCFLLSTSSLSAISEPTFFVDLQASSFLLNDVFFFCFVNIDFKVISVKCSLHCVYIDVF